MPSSFMILVSREQLYDFQLKNPRLDLVIKTILRLTEGAFQHFCNINESAVARLLKTQVSEVVPALQQLHKEGIIDYRPAKDKPQLLFSQERVDADNLLIDMEMYKFRKERYARRIAKAIAYATTPRCRSQQLLEYFDEKSEPCGVCDVCLGRTKTSLTVDDFERYKLKIKQLLSKERLSEQQLLEAFASNRHPNVVQALGYLLDEGMISNDKGMLVWNA